MHVDRSRFEYRAATLFHKFRHRTDAEKLPFQASHPAAQCPRAAIRHRIVGDGSRPAIFLWCRFDTSHGGLHLADNTIHNRALRRRFVLAPKGFHDTDDTVGCDNGIHDGRKPLGDDRYAHAHITGGKTGSGIRLSSINKFRAFCTFDFARRRPLLLGWSGCLRRSAGELRNCAH